MWPFKKKKPKYEVKKNDYDKIITAHERGEIFAEENREKFKELANKIDAELLEACEKNYRNPGCVSEFKFVSSDEFKKTYPDSEEN